MNELSLIESTFLQTHNISITDFLRARSELNDTRSDIMPEWVHSLIMRIVNIVNEETGYDPERAERFLDELMKNGTSSDSSQLIFQEP